jgi:tetratricopeptide (TPR) repeat protein
MKKILFALLFLTGTVVYGQSAFAKAEQLYRAEKYDKALFSFSKLYEQDSTDLNVVERLGDIAGHKKDFETAMNYYKLLLEIKPKDAHYNFKYGGAMGLYAKGCSKLKALSMLDDIKMYLKRAARLDSNHIESRHALSQLYCELPGIVGGSIMKSRSYAVELLKLSPVDGHLAHGFIDEYEEDYGKAIASYSKAVETGGSLVTYRKLAAVYEDKLKNYEKAIKVLKRAQQQHQDKQLVLDIATLKTRLQISE